MCNMSTNPTNSLHLNASAFTDMFSSLDYQALQYKNNNMVFISITLIILDFRHIINVGMCMGQLMLPNDQNSWLVLQTTLVFQTVRLNDFVARLPTAGH